jgi:hypothetical protein
VVARARFEAAGGPAAEARHRARDFIDRLAYRAGVAALYHTRVGVKQTNQLFKSAMIDAYVTGDRVAVEPAGLRLGVDALRDDFTMLEATVAASPHLALVRSLSAPGHEPASAYLERVRHGTLDWRPPRRVSPALVEGLRRGVTARLEEMERGDPFVVRVAWIDDEPYIVDGRHRAAVAAMCGCAVLCEDVLGVYGDSYFQWISAVAARRSRVHRTHLHFWSRVQREINNRPRRS